MNAAVILLGPTGDELMSKWSVGRRPEEAVEKAEWEGGVPKTQGGPQDMWKSAHTVFCRRALCSVLLWRWNMPVFWLRNREHVTEPSVLTNTHWSLSRPLVVLQTYPNRGSHEPEARTALIHHRVPVAESVSTDVTVHDWVWGAAVAS